MPINKFTTLLDLARQAKILTGETATFDGKIQVGIPFSGYPSGIDTGSAVSLGVVSSEDAVFSGNTGTTVFDVSNPLSPNYNALFSGYTATTWTNPIFSANTSGLTLPITPFSADTQIVGPFWTLTQTGMTGDYVIGTQYTGYTVTYSFYDVSTIGTGSTFSGFTTASQQSFSAGTLDYKGPLDYLSSKEDATVEGRLTTNKITITNGASASTIGYVLTQLDETGKAGWVYNSASASTNTFVTGGTVTNADLNLNWNTGGSATPIDLTPIGSNGSYLVPLIFNQTITTPNSGVQPSFGSVTLGSGSTYSSILGGNNNILHGTYSIIGGGNSNYMSGGTTNGIFGGQGNTIHDSNGAAIFNGRSCSIYGTSTNSIIGGGYNNNITNSSIRSFIGGGSLNNISGSTRTVIVGGSGNIARETDYSFIGGGDANYVNGGDYHFIGGGYNNTVSGKYGVIVGGVNNSLSGISGSIIGGSGNTVSHQNAHIIGSNITTLKSNTTHVEGLIINTIGGTTPIGNLGFDSSGFVVTGTTSFTGNTSGDCINDIYVSNIHSCSPLNINSLDEGNVYFGSTSGVTIDVINNRLGINTDLPIEKLHVEGGNIYVNNNFDGTTKIDLRNKNVSNNANSSVSLQVSGTGLTDIISGGFWAFGPDYVPSGTFLGPYLPNSLTIATAGAGISERLNINIGSRRGSDSEIRFFGGSSTFNSSSLLGTFYTSGLTITDKVNTDTFRIRSTSTPTGTTDTFGVIGDVSWDDDYIYIKTSIGWRRSPLSSW